MFQVDTGLQDREEPRRSSGVIHKGLSLLFWVIVKRRGLGGNPAFLGYQRDSEVQNQMLIRKSLQGETQECNCLKFPYYRTCTHTEREFY